MFFMRKNEKRGIHFPQLNAEFTKVSKEIFENDMITTSRKVLKFDSREDDTVIIINTQYKTLSKPVANNSIELDVIYDDIKIPTRSTKGSIGYDFYYPYDQSIDLKPYDRAIIPTGIKVFLGNDYEKGMAFGLFLFPRSSLGIRGLQIQNTVGIVDPDFYNNPTNEGEIYVYLYHNGSTDDIIHIGKNDRFCQGIILPAYFALNDMYNDNLTKTREGGYGSTGS